MVRQRFCKSCMGVRLSPVPPKGSIMNPRIMKFRKLLKAYASADLEIAYQAELELITAFERALNWHKLLWNTLRIYRKSNKKLVASNRELSEGAGNGGRKIDELSTVVERQEGALVRAYDYIEIIEAELRKERAIANYYADNGYLFAIKIRKNRNQQIGEFKNDLTKHAVTFEQAN